MYYCTTFKVTKTSVFSDLKKVNYQLIYEKVAVNYYKLMST